MSIAIVFIAMLVTQTPIAFYTLMWGSLRLAPINVHNLYGVHIYSSKCFVVLIALQNCVPVTVITSM